MNENFLKFLGFIKLDYQPNWKIMEKKLEELSQTKEDDYILPSYKIKDIYSILKIANIKINKENENNRYLIQTIQPFILFSGFAFLAILLNMILPLPLGALLVPIAALYIYILWKIKIIFLGEVLPILELEDKMEIENPELFKPEN